MSSTPEDLYGIAVQMKDDGAPLAAIVHRVVEAGARQVDLVRVLHQIEGVGFGQAVELVNSTAVIPAMPTGLTIVVPDGWHWDDEPWDNDLLPPE